MKHMPGPEAPTHSLVRSPLARFAAWLMVFVLVVPGVGAAPSSYAVVTPPAHVLAGGAPETISFPGRSSDLADDSYWTVSEFGEGCCILDLNVRRWDGGSWSKGGSSTNAQNFDWNVPLYAPASGVIASCWRNFPDDPSPGVNPANNNIFSGGNHVVIITDQGNAITLAHMKSGTIRAELCPSNAGSTQYPPSTTKQGYWRVDAYIVPANRPRITEGELIGRVGNSGNSSGPHLHMGLNEISGTDAWGREATNPASPMRFRFGWGHRFEADEQDTAAGWYRLRGGEVAGDTSCDSYQDNAPTCGFRMLHASPYLRRASASAGAVKDVATVFLTDLRAVTAVIDSSNELKLIAWDLVGLDTINRKGDISAGVVKEVQIVEAATDHVLVAVRGQDDELKMIAYSVTPTGAFVRRADATAGKISALAMAATGGADRKAVTAVRDAAGNLKVIAWDIQFAPNGTVSVARLGDASAGPVSAVSISRASAFNGVFTAVRDSNNDLKVIPWKLSANGDTITRGDDVSAGTIGTQVAIAPLAQGVAAAMRDSDGNLRVITWSVSSDGNIGARRDTGVAGAISEVNILGTPLAASNLTTVVRDSTGALLLIGWAISDNGTNLRRVGSSRAGDATKIAADGVYRSYVGLDPRDMILTAMRDSQGNLKLVTWDTNLNNP